MSDDLSGFTPVPDVWAADRMGYRRAVVYGAVWRLAQQVDGRTCVAPIRLIGMTAGQSPTVTRPSIERLVELGWLRRAGQHLVIARECLSAEDPSLAALIASDRRRGVGRCVHCKRPATTLDHDLPKCRGGKNGPENLQPMCAGCNADKGPLTTEEWRKGGVGTERAMITAGAHS